MKLNKRLLDCGYYVCNVIGNAVNSSTRLQKTEFHNADDIRSFVDMHVIGSIFGCVKADSDLQKEVNTVIARQVKFDIMCDKISEKLSEKNIRHIVLKGSEIQKFYPSNIVRKSSDIDIYIDKKDVAVVDGIMRELGFLSGETNDENYQYLKQPRYNVEFHTTLEGYSDNQKKILLKLSENAVHVKGTRYVLSDSDAYIHALFHLFKHFVYSGVGVRMFLDLYLISKNACIDFDYANKVLRELEIAGFAQAVNEINKVLFENAKPTDDQNELAEFIFNSPLYGARQTNIYLSNFNHGAKHIGRWKLLDVKYGVGFNSMCKRYPVLRKAPVLYPLSFIHRFGYGMIHKRDVLKNARDNKKSLSYETINKYKRVFEIANIKL